MSEDCNLLYHFLKLTRGLWRNAFYIECPVCPRNSHCRGHLLTADAEGAPLILPVPYFEKMTGDKVDKFECTAIINRESFENLFHQWMVWNVTKPEECSILQILPQTDTYTP